MRRFADVLASRSALSQRATKEVVADLAAGGDGEAVVDRWYRETIASRRARRRCDRLHRTPSAAISLVRLTGRFRFDPRCAGGTESLRRSLKKAGSDAGPAASLRPSRRNTRAHGCAGSSSAARSALHRPPNHEHCRGGPMTHSIDAPLPPPATTGTGATAPRRRPRRPPTSTKDSPSTRPRTSGRPPPRPAARSPPPLPTRPRKSPRRPSARPRTCSTRAAPRSRTRPITQQQKAGQSLTSLAQELRGLADGTSSGAPGPARDLLQQASGMVESFARKLQNREPAELLDEVRSFARRKPGLFLLGAAAAGVLAGRLTSGVKAAHSDASSIDRRPATARSPTTSTLRRPTRTTRPDYRPARRTDGEHLRRHRRGHRRPAAAAAVRHRAARGQRGPARQPRPAGTTRPAVRVGWADP